MTVHLFLRGGGLKDKMQSMHQDFVDLIEPVSIDSFKRFMDESFHVHVNESLSEGNLLTLMVDYLIRVHASGVNAEQCDAARSEFIAQGLRYIAEDERFNRIPINFAVINKTLENQLVFSNRPGEYLPALSGLLDYCPGYHINASGDDGITLLMRACVNAPFFNIEMINNIIALGADVNARSLHFGSPIHFVDKSSSFAYEMYKYLIEKGAEPHDSLEFKAYSIAVDHSGKAATDEVYNPTFNCLMEYLEDSRISSGLRVRELNDLRTITQAFTSGKQAIEGLKVLGGAQSLKRRSASL